MNMQTVGIVGLGALGVLLVSGCLKTARMCA